MGQIKTNDQEKQRILTERHSKSTQAATVSNIKCFNAYLKEKNYPEESEITDADLPEALFNFYCDLRKSNRDIYKLNSLKCMRAGIN